MSNKKSIKLVFDAFFLKLIVQNKAVNYFNFLHCFNFFNALALVLRYAQNLTWVD